MTVLRLYRLWSGLILPLGAANIPHAQLNVSPTQSSLVSLLGKLASCCKVKVLGCVPRGVHVWFLRLVLILPGLDASFADIIRDYIYKYSHGRTFKSQPTSTVYKGVATTTGFDTQLRQVHPLSPILGLDSDITPQQAEVYASEIVVPIVEDDREDFNSALLAVTIPEDIALRYSSQSTSQSPALKTDEDEANTNKFNPAAFSSRTVVVVQDVFVEDDDYHKLLAATGSSPDNSNVLSHKEDESDWGSTSKGSHLSIGISRVPFIGHTDFGYYIPPVPTQGVWRYDFYSADMGYSADGQYLPSHTSLQYSETEADNPLAEESDSSMGSMSFGGVDGSPRSSDSSVSDYSSSDTGDEGMLTRIIMSQCDAEPLEVVPSDSVSDFDLDGPVRLTESDLAAHDHLEYDHAAPPSYSNSHLPPNYGGYEPVGLARMLHTSTKKDVLDNGRETFRITGKIGHGGFGHVMLAETSDHKRVAIKVMHKPLLYQRSGMRQYAIKELDILKHITVDNKPFLAPLLCSWTDDENIYFVMKLYNETLLHQMHRGPLCVEDIKIYAAQLVTAVDNLHQSGILHCDIKPENILMDADGQIALCDFGLSQFLEDIEKSGSLESGGTAGYTAPEAIRGEHIPGAEAAVDVWSLGMVLLELALGLRYSYFYGDVSSEANRRVMEEELPLRHVQDTVLRDMLRGMLNRDASERTTVKALKNHPYFAGISFDAVYHGYVRASTRSGPLYLDADQRYLHFSLRDLPVYIPAPCEGELSVFDVLDDQMEWNQVDIDNGTFDFSCNASLRGKLLHGQAAEDSESWVLYSPSR